MLLMGEVIIYQWGKGINMEQNWCKDLVLNRLLPPYSHLRRDICKSPMNAHILHLSFYSYITDLKTYWLYTKYWIIYNFNMLRYCWFWKDILLRPKNRFCTPLPSYCNLHIYNPPHTHMINNDLSFMTSCVKICLLN